MNLHKYHRVVINTSGGKDSQATLDYVVAQAIEQDYPLENLVAVHANLGAMEWEGTATLASAQADRYGVRFIEIRREQDLLAQVRQRGKWPSATCRYCTSDHKRDQIAKIITILGAGRTRRGCPESFRVLNCLGMRAEESPARRKLLDFTRDTRLSNGSRTVDRWLPIHAWTAAEVWAAIKRSGVPHHPAYDLGMPRLSCVFCIFAPRSALLLAGLHNRPLLDRYVETERAIGHTFRKELPILEIQRALDAGERPAAVLDWTM